MGDIIIVVDPPIFDEESIIGCDIAYSAWHMDMQESIVAVHFGREATYIAAQ